MTQDNIQGILYIISAPSGTGKTSLVEKIIQDDPQIKISISYTTRPQRTEVEEGKNYHFISEQEFEEMINKGVFLEYAKVFRHYYGTSKAWVEEALSAGMDVILEIDWQGAEQIRKRFPEAISIYILPPSRESLRARLVGRGQDDSEVIEERLAEARDELTHCSEYDYIVVNDNFEEALANIRSIFRANRLSVAVQTRRYRKLIKELLNRT